MADKLRSPAQRVAGEDPEGLRREIAGLSRHQARDLLFDWRFWARANQLAPAGDWRCWLVLAGRGFGKTRMGAEWVRGLAESATPLGGSPAAGRLALIAETAQDGREVMVEGESGIIACSPPDRRPRYESSRRRLVWPNGVRAYVYSASDPDQLRGPQHHAAWADELAKWRDPEPVWANLMLGLRLGDHPQVLATTTPRPLPFLRKLCADPGTLLTRGSTRDNRANLSRAFLREIDRLYGGTRLGRQEIDGEILNDGDGLWAQATIDAYRVEREPPLARILVGVDPPAGHGRQSVCGIIIVGQAHDGDLYVLADESIEAARPTLWANAAIRAVRRFGAERIVAETNQGGDMVVAVLAQVDPAVRVEPVRARAGKLARAEPIAALYEQGRAHHVGRLPELEAQLCDYTGAPGQRSPDRLDALVWAMAACVGRQSAEPRLSRL